MSDPFDLEDENQFWEKCVDLANATREMLEDKPDRLKIGFSRSPNGILNAYREGDLNFEEAVKALNNRPAIKENERLLKELSGLQEQLKQAKESAQDANWESHGEDT